MVMTSGWVPVLHVRDAATSADWYCGCLGFEREWEHRFEPELPLFVSLRRGELRLFLSEHRGDGGHGCETYLYVDDLLAFHAQAAAAGAHITQPPRDEPWGVREMRLTDPDGHRFRIGQFPVPRD